MGKQTVEVLVDAGKATAGPPIGSSLGQLGVNVGKIVMEINEKTKALAGMQVPVKIIVDTSTKHYEIKIGTPPVSALIKKKLAIEKGSGTAGTARVGDLTEEQVKEIAMTKFGHADGKVITQVKGTARSMGVTIGMGAVTAEELKRAEKVEEVKPVAPVEEKPAAPAPEKKEEKKEAKKRRLRKGK